MKDGTVFPYFQQIHRVGWHEEYKSLKDDGLVNLIHAYEIGILV